MTLPTDAQLDERLMRLAGTLPASIVARRPVVTPQRVRATWSPTAAPAIAAVLIVVVAGVLQLTARPSTDVHVGALGSAAPSLTAVSSPTAAAASPDAAAAAACEAIKDVVPLVLLRSGEATVAGASTMDATSLGAYLWTVQAGVNPVTVVGPVADAVTIACVIDGDFDTRTPGPPGHDTTATRILVLVRDGQPELWAITRDPASMPIPDELASAGASASAPPVPGASGSTSTDGTFLLASHGGSDCGGEGDPRPARIRAAASDPEHVWLELDGERLTAFWPEGTTVRFDGDRPVRIRDADGTVLATAGQRLSATSLRGCLDIGKARISLYLRLR